MLRDISISMITLLKIMIFSSVIKEIINHNNINREFLKSSIFYLFTSIILSFWVYSFTPAIIIILTKILFWILIIIITGIIIIGFIDDKLGHVEILTVIVCISNNIILWFWLRTLPKI